MKITDLNKELSALSKSEIEVKIGEWRRQLLSLRLNSATSHVKDHSQFKKLRSNIARGLTFLQKSAAETVDQKEHVNG